MRYVMVLNDGETYTDLEGCSVVVVPSHLSDSDLDEFVKHSDGFYCFSDNFPLPCNNSNAADGLDMIDEVTLMEEENIRREEEYELGRQQWLRRVL